MNEQQEHRDELHHKQRATAETAPKVLDFARAILHGDEVHRAWLLEAADAYENGRDIPPPRSGTPK